MVLSIGYVGSILTKAAPAFKMPNMQTMVSKDLSVIIAIISFCFTLWSIRKWAKLLAFLFNSEYVNDLLSHTNAMCFGFSITCFSNKVIKVSSLVGSSISLNSYNTFSLSEEESMSIFEIFILTSFKTEFNIFT